MTDMRVTAVLAFAAVAFLAAAISDTYGRERESRRGRGRDRLAGSELRASASGRGQAGDGLVKVEGVLTSVAPDGGSATIKRRNGTTVTFLVLSSTKIERNGNRVGSALNLVIGDAAQARLDPTMQFAVKLESRGL